MTTRSIRPLVLAAALAFTSALVLGCSSEPAPEPVGTTESAMMAGDCSQELGECYGSCQATAPSPTPGCFDDCGTEFTGCLDRQNNPSPVKPIYN